MAWKSKAEKAVRAIESGARVKADVKAQLTLAGYADDVAAASAKIFSGHIMCSAERMEVDPETYFKVHANVKFVRGYADMDGGTLAQAEISRADVEAVQSIGRKSVNDFSSDDADNTSV